MAEWLGRALQKLLQRFESARDLDKNTSKAPNFGAFAIDSGPELFQPLILSSMTIKEAAYVVKSSLQGYYDLREAAAIKEMIMEDLTGLNRVDRILHDRKELTPGQCRRLDCSIKYLERKMPVQYVLGYAYFMDLRLKVNSQVLIPRPETEELVCWIAEAMQEQGTNAARSLLDIGTGSGCIPLGVKHCFNDWEVFGCDISDGALGVARHNSRLTGLKASFFRLDILTDNAAEQLQSCLPPIDIIVSNPPYISYDEKAQMAGHVLDYEPHLALFPETGLPATIFYRKIAELAAKVLAPDGWLFMEINPLYVKEISGLLKKAGGLQIEIKTDLQGRERMVKCLFKS